MLHSHLKHKVSKTPYVDPWIKTIQYLDCHTHTHTHMHAHVYTNMHTHRCTLVNITILQFGQFADYEVIRYTAKIVPYYISKEKTQHYNDKMSLE